MLCQSGIWAGFGLPVSVSGILAERYALTVSDWAERTPTEQNIERSVTPLRFAHMLWLSPYMVQMEVFPNANERERAWHLRTCGIYQQWLLNHVGKNYVRTFDKYGFCCT